MSALPPKADIRGAKENVAKGQKRTLCPMGADGRHTERSVHCGKHIASYLSDDRGDVVRNLWAMRFHFQKFGFRD
jgi:hypothetical protein